MSTKGQRVSIISSFDIRYEGLLYAISNDHVVLKDVKNFGCYYGGFYENIDKYQEQDKLIIQLKNIKDLMPIEEAIMRKIIRINNQDISISNSRVSVPHLPEIKLSQYQSRRNTEENNSSYLDAPLNQSMFVENHRSKYSSSVHRDRYSRFIMRESDPNIQIKKYQYKGNLASSQCVKKYANSPSRYFAKSQTPNFDIGKFIKKNEEDCQNYNFLKKQDKPSKYYIQRKYY